TFFDINPRQLAFVNIIRRVWIESESAGDFLARLANAEYEVDTEEDQAIRTNIAAKQNGVMLTDRGASRSFLSSWRYALDHFDLTRQLLDEVPVTTRLEGMQSPSFGAFVTSTENLWIYCSNVMWFAFFDLTVHHPQNSVLLASYFDKTEVV